jgi:hypothetical protein
MSKKVYNHLSRNIAAVYLVLMCIQIIFIEGYGVSNIKVGAMAVAVLITLWKVPFISKATIWSFLFMITVLFSAIVWNNNYRSSTLIYSLLFLVMFNMYYGLIIKGAFSLNFFLRLVKGLLFAYVIVLLLQQMSIMIGIRILPIINLTYFVNRGIGSNSLALEPSHSARIMAVAFYTFLKVNEIRQRKPLSLKQLFVENRWLTLGFLYAMATMGSGTAFVALAILSLYFIRRQYALFIVPVALLLYVTIPQINFEPLNRARAAIELTMNGDAKEIKEEDLSASVRIDPLLNTFDNLDLFSGKTWFGKGSDTGNKLGLTSDKRMMGSINDYGLISFIAGIFLVLMCSVPRLISIDTLLIFILVGFTVNNIAYIWGIYMLLTPVKYFYKKYAYAK